MTVQSKKCVVSLGTANSRYVDGLARLSNSLRDNASGIDFLGFIHERSVGAPLHTENNYAFKVYAIQRAIDAGYDEILWLDCSVWAVAPVQPLFDIIHKQGYWFEGAGCWLGNWCSDKVLDYWDINRDDAMKAPMIQSGFMGFDMKSPFIFTLWSSFKIACNVGLFNGAWTNDNKTESEDERCLGSRHDQSVISCILHNAEIEYSHTAQYVQYSGIYDKQLNDSIILRCQGM